MITIYLCRQLGMAVLLQVLAFYMLLFVLLFGYFDSMDLIYPGLGYAYFGFGLALGLGVPLWTIKQLKTAHPMGSAVEAYHYPIWYRFLIAFTYVTRADLDLAAMFQAQHLRSYLKAEVPDLWALVCEARRLMISTGELPVADKRYIFSLDDEETEEDSV